MSDIDSARRRFEVLKIARDLLNEQYLAQRHESHSKWLADSEAHYKSTGGLLPYPALAPYPSESDIINKAASLYKYVETGTVQPPPLSPREAQAISRVSPSPDTVPVPPVTAEPAWNTGPLPVEQPPALPVQQTVQQGVAPVPQPVAPQPQQSAPVAQAEPASQNPAPPPAAQVPKIFAPASNNLMPSAYAPSPLPMGLPLNFLPPNKGQ